MRRSISFFRTSLALTSSLVGEIGDGHALGERDGARHRRRRSGRERLHLHARALIAARTAGTRRRPVASADDSRDGHARPRRLRSAGSAATAAAAGRPRRLTRRQRARPLRRRAAAPAAAGAPGRVPAGRLRLPVAACGGAAGACRRPDEHRPARRRGRRLSGSRILDAQPHGRRHDASGRRRDRTRRRGCRRDAAVGSAAAGARRFRRGGFAAPRAAIAGSFGGLGLACRRQAPARRRAASPAAIGSGSGAGGGGTSRDRRRNEHGLRRGGRRGQRLRGWRRRAAWRVLTRRGGGSAGAAGFGGSGALPGLPSLRRRGRVGERRVRRHADAALARQALDELPRDDLFDRARRALHLDAVIALQQRDHFLARRVEQLRDLVNPDCCHSVKSISRCS